MVAAMMLLCEKHLIRPPLLMMIPFNRSDRTLRLDTENGNDWMKLGQSMLDRSPVGSAE